VAEHMMAMPWNDSLLTKSFEKHLYYGNHTTVCRKRDGQLALVKSLNAIESLVFDYNLTS